MRVFKIKKDELMKDLRSGKIFGPVAFEMSCIEWQKRGLPHLHLVIKFEGPLPDEGGEMDEWCWAEVPPADLNGGKAREQVLNCMVHRECGPKNIASPCMQDDRSRPGVKVCGKRYPQPWRTAAVVNGKTGRAEYRRRDTGEKFPYKHKVNGKFVESYATNQWIAPYNIWLLSKYNCHMCFDVCTGKAIVKYIYKYINKGSDSLKLGYCVMAMR